MDKIELAFEHMLESIIRSVPGIILALISLVIGSWVIRLILKFIRRRFERRSVDLSLREFVISIVKFVLYTMLIISSASMMGIQTTSFIAVLGAASLSIGLALQGSLSNFAGGLLILLFKPFRVGDYISSDAKADGTVEKIDILYTTLRSAEGITVSVPNGPLANTVVRNYSNIPRRRAEYKLGIAYDSDIAQARKLIFDIFAADKRILKKPIPEVRVDQIADNTITLVIRMWTNNNVYWDAYYETYEKIKDVLDQAGIRVPVPQHEFHLVNHKDSDTPEGE